MEFEPRPQSIGFLALLTATLLLIACGEETTPADEEDTGSCCAAETGSDPDAGNTDTQLPVTGWEATVYRVSAVTVVEPTHVSGILSGLVNTNIEANLLHVLIETENFSAETGEATFDITGGAGELGEDGNFTFIEGAESSPATVDADGNFENGDPTELSFPIVLAVPPGCLNDDCPDGCRDDLDCPDTYYCDGATGDCAKAVIVPLKDVIISGTFESDAEGLQILDGAELRGAILKEDADTIEIDITGSGTAGDLPMLTEILTEGTMDYPDSENPIGWVLSSLLSASQVSPESAD